MNSFSLGGGGRAFCGGRMEKEEGVELAKLAGRVTFPEKCLSLDW